MPVGVRPSLCAFTVLLSLQLVVPGRTARAAPDFDAAAGSARQLIEALVAADTTNPPGNEARAVALGAERLRAAGIPYEVTEFAPGRENLVARLRGDGSLPPVLLLAHIDVVGTEGQQWSSDPRRVVEKDGALQARGVSDDLGMAALELEVLSLLQRERVPLTRDVILAWTGDEESGGLGIRWLLANKPESIDAPVVLNEGGGVRLGADGKPAFIELQTAEKTYQDFTITARGPTGHSSVPLHDNAIYRLANALARLERHTFPARLLPVTRAWLRERSRIESPEVGEAMRKLADSTGELPADALSVLEANPVLAANLRTTCVATLISGGTRVNALPASATATVNCRIVPEETPEQVHEELVRVLADASLEIEPSQEFGFGEPSPLEGPGPAAIAKVAREMWPGIPIIPFMSRGATDSRFLRARGAAAYGIDPTALTEEDARRAHGIDERLPIASLRPAVEFLYRLVVELAAKR
jgi:acetylornithine deacetylase/succinyl-diaminopimelate desuccinylase-like protein